ncbi:hypothetical protein CHCC20375_1354 [Bacillus licheniformis]|nr:hypothetical protein CHCC20375_1354 [Bacillus licheniformis]
MSSNDPTSCHNKINMTGNTTPFPHANRKAAGLSFAPVFGWIEGVLDETALICHLPLSALFL